MPGARLHGAVQESEHAAAPMSQRAYDVLRDRLVMLDIPPGEPINEAALAAELGIGRTPIREALKRLETDRLVVSFARRGTFATRVDITDLAAISEMRLALEPLAAAKAAANSHPQMRADLERMAREIEALDDTSTRREVMMLDMQVHRLIYRAAGNEHLEQTLVRLDDLATRIWCLVLDRLPAVTGYIGEHVALLDAIARGRGDEAARRAAEHVTHFERAVRACL